MQSVELQLMSVSSQDRPGTPPLSAPAGDLGNVPRSLVDDDGNRPLVRDQPYEALLQTTRVQRWLYRQRVDVDELQFSDWSSSASWLVGQRFRAARRIEVAVETSAQAMMTDRLRRLLRTLVAVCAMAARQSTMPVEKVTIRSSRDVEEGWTEVVVEIGVSAKAEQALAFWDSLGRAVDRWTAFLPANETKFVREEIAVHVNWA